MPMPTLRPRALASAAALFFLAAAGAPLAAASTATPKPPSGASSPTAARANGATVAPAGKSATQAATPVAAAQIVRIYFLQGIAPYDALKLMRTEASLRSVATVQSRGALVVSGAAAEIEKAEALLNARHLVQRTAHPVSPLDLAKIAAAPRAERSFAIASSEEREADLLFRSVLGVRDISRDRATQTLVVRAATPLLDAGEKLLAALGMLGSPAAAPAAAESPAPGVASQ